MSQNCGADTSDALPAAYRRGVSNYVHQKSYPGHLVLKTSTLYYLEGEIQSKEAVSTDKATKQITHICEMHMSVFHVNSVELIQCTILSPA